MKKYAMEFVGTFLFVLSIAGIIGSGIGALIPLSIGITLMALVYMGGSVSGAHYNPAVTIGLCWSKKITPKDAILYIVSQIIAALAAYAMAKYLFHWNLNPANISTNTREVFAAELIGTFMLVSVILHVAASKATAGNSYFGFAIGATVVAMASVFSGVSGGFFNPAVLTGIGLYGISMTNISAIIIAEIVGGTLASWFHTFTVGGQK